MPSDPTREFAVEVVHRLKVAGFQALWAGGCVRDFLLGRDPQDYDVATNALPEQVRDLFGRRRTLAVGAAFGVVIVLAPKPAGNVEVATFRCEGPYLDGRRPQHVLFTSAEEDARRRDFTINGIFYDPIEGRVLDYVGGEKDLAAGVIRAIGEPHERMREDKLRMLRAVRFSAALEFELDPGTADAIRDMAGEIQVISEERIAQELKKMLVDRHRMRAMQLARSVGLLPVIVPEVTSLDEESGSPDLPSPWQRTVQALNLLQAPTFELAAAVLLHAVRPPLLVPGEAPAGAALKTPEAAGLAAETARAICRRLRLSNQETGRIAWLVARQHDLVEAPRLPAAALKRLMAHPDFPQLLALVRACTLAAAGDLTPVLFCEETLRRTPPEEIDPPLLLTGDDLIARGLKPGPRFKEILERVRDAQLNGEIATRDDAFALVDRLHTEHRQR